MKKETLMVILSATLVVIFLILIALNDIEKKEDPVNELDMNCLITYADSYCQRNEGSDSVLVQDHKFNCIVEDKERENVKILSNTVYFLESEIRACTTIKLNDQLN